MTGPAVLMWAPAVSPVGGHRVQQSMTAAALRDLGWDVTVSHEPAQAVAGFDLVHGFGLSLSQVRRARLSGARVVLSSIHWAKSYRLGYGHPRTRVQDLRLRARNAAVMVRAAARNRLHDKAEGYVRWVVDTTALYESADMLLPNSVAEADSIVADLGVTTPWHIVPNGVSPELFPEAVQAPEAHRRGVICVGRVEPHKNQLGVIRACQALGLPLRIVGKPHPDHPDYVRRCRRESGDMVEWLDIDMDDHLGLATALGEARVHALASYFETTGLASLEAALMGCRIVTTSRGFARSYFEDHAWYCDPDDALSVRRAIRSAHEASPTPALRERVLAKYTWQEAAQETGRAYRSTLRLSTTSMPARGGVE